MRFQIQYKVSEKDKSSVSDELVWQEIEIEDYVLDYCSKFKWYRFTDYLPDELSEIADDYLGGDLCYFTVINAPKNTVSMTQEQLDHHQRKWSLPMVPYSYIRDVLGILKTKEVYTEGKDIQKSLLWGFDFRYYTTNDDFYTYKAMTIKKYDPRLIPA